jgi:hypothetical protein
MERRKYHKLILNCNPYNYRGRGRHVEGWEFQNGLAMNMPKVETVKVGK